MQQFSNAGQDEPEKIQAEASKFMPAEEVPSKYAVAAYDMMPADIYRIHGGVLQL